MARLRDNDILFAYKALTIVPNLSGTDRQVAGAIIDHYNRRTDQCDPGGQRLATLLAINRATVIRATERLNSFGLIHKQSHGGHAHRATYRPNWERLTAIVQDWEGRMKTGAAPEEQLPTTSCKVTKQRHLKAQDCNIESRNLATQTNLTNQSNKPTKIERVATGAQPLIENLQKTKPFEFTNLPKWRKRTSCSEAQHSVSHAQAAEAAANRRWDSELRGLGPNVYIAAVEQITPKLAEAATLAEMRRRGDGVVLLIDELSRIPLGVGVQISDPILKLERR